ncbi:hypothetical protein [Bacillus mycoides]|uniref:hypothetical protein n=1 Tax=Bacillus mycoides TaxID=1405 RepID=UPI0021CDA916|nr:hypothetical protein [Bacillus mycoides]MCU5656268.1 hypothetical protein [Bacillus mycoides]
MLGWSITNIVTITGITLTFLVGVVNIFITKSTSYKNRNVSTVTTQRINWMGVLREYVSEYISLIENFDTKALEQDSKDHSDYFQSVIKAATKIKLHLYYSGREENEIINIVEKLKDNMFELYKLVYHYSECEPYRNLEKYDVILEDKNLKIFHKKFGQKAKDENEQYITSSNEFTLDGENSDDNHNDVNDKRLKLISEAYSEALEEIRDTILRSSNDLVLKSQNYLKNEWSRVKKEAKEGKLT